jgi:hypothetical protein
VPPAIHVKPVAGSSSVRACPAPVVVTIIEAIVMAIEPPSLTAIDTRPLPVVVVEIDPTDVETTDTDLYTTVPTSVLRSMVAVHVDVVLSPWLSTLAWTFQTPSSPLHFWPL